MTTKIPTRNTRIQENIGSSVSYQTSTPTPAPRGFQRYQNKNTSALASSMDSLSQIIAMQGKKSTQDDIKTAMALGAKDGELVPGEEYSEAFRESYWESKGARAVSDFRTEALKIRSENPNMDPAEFDTRIKGLFQNRMIDMPDAFSIGFAPEAHQIKNSLVSAHRAEHAARIRKEDIDNKGLEFRNWLRPDMAPEDLRAIWSSFQGKAVSAGYGRDEINKEFMGHLTEFVIEQINAGDETAILLFDGLKVPDENGVRLKDTGDLETEYRSALGKAMRAQEIREAEEDRERVERREEIHKDAFTLTHEVLRGNTRISKVQDYLDQNRDLMAPRTLQALEKFITDDLNGDHRYVDEYTDRDVFTRATNSTLEDDYSEDQLSYLYTNGKIRRETYVTAMRRYTITNSADYRAVVNSGAFRIAKANMDNLRHFRFMELERGDIVPESFGGTSQNPKVTYLDIAVNELNQRISERLSENGQVSQEEVKEIGKEVKEEIQARAEKSEQNPIKVLLDHQRSKGGKIDDSFIDLYRYLSGDLTMSNRQVIDELVQLGHLVKKSSTTTPQTPQTTTPKPTATVNYPEGIENWNVQVMSQNGKQVPMRISESGPVPLTPEEHEMYRRYSSEQKGLSIDAMVKWFQENMTGVQKIHKEE